jgi:hypothetical protein
LVGNGALDRLTTEGKAGDGGGDDQQRCDGEDGVVGNGGAAAHRAVVDETFDRVPQQRPCPVQHRSHSCVGAVIEPNPPAERMACA